MPMTHRPEISAEVDSENWRQNWYRFLKSFFIPNPLRMKIGAENKHGRVQRKNYEFSV